MAQPRRSASGSRPAGRRVLAGGVAAGGDAGQVMPIFAVCLVAFVAMLALVIDVGVLYGQRRYAQNGADAAALATGKLMAANQFVVDDSGLYREARFYAGLKRDPTLADPAAPTGINQQLGLQSRTRLVVTLEYDNGDGGGWCVSPASLTPPPYDLPAAPNTCSPARTAMLNGSLFKMRVTVNATTDGFFARAIGLGDSTAPSCLRPTGSVPGITTCATAVVTASNTGGPTVRLTQ